MLRRLMPLGLLLTMVGCLSPVSESNDSGHGGGTGGTGGAGGAGGGGTGGAGGGGTIDGGACTTAADCSGTKPSVQFCSALTGAAYSCVNSQCLWECNGGRTCAAGNLDGQRCLQCGMTPTCEVLANCEAVVRSAVVESSTCANYPHTQVPFADDRWQLSGTRCRLDARQADGGLELGTLYRLADGDFVAEFAPLGGQCTGIGLPTGLERWLFNCPDCQFVLRL